MDLFQDMKEFGVIARQYEEIDKSIDINYWLCFEFILPYGISFPPNRPYSIPSSDGMVLAYRYMMVDVPYRYYGEDTPLMAKHTLVTAARSLKELPREKKALLSDTFDICIDYLNRFLYAYLLVRKDISVYPITIQHLQPSILYGFWDREGKEIEKSRGLFLLNWNVPTQTVVLSDEEITHISNLMLIEHPFEISEIMMLQARRELTSGLYGQAVISSESSFETFADPLLQILLTRKGCTENEIRSIFDSQNFVPRLKKNFSGIIGGNFSLTSGILKKWKDETSELRNAVVHAGYRPTHDEAHRAINAAADGRLYIISLLKKRPKEFRDIIRLLT